MNSMVSKNFSMTEFMCHCGCTMSVIVDERVRKLVEKLQHLRDVINIPILVTSGYRCPEYDEKVWRESGGTGPYHAGQHTWGTAADVWVRSLPLRDFWNAALSIFCDGGMGFYADYRILHLDLGPKRTWGHINGVYVSLEEALGSD